MPYWIGERADIITLSGEGRPSFTPAPDPLTPKQQSQAAVSAVAKLIAFGCAFFTVILLLFSAWYIYRLHQTLSSSPHTQAQVLSTQIYTQEVRVGGNRGTVSHSTVYGFRCNVSYSVASSAYQSQADIGYQKSDHAEIASWSDRIRPGDQIEIAYSPSDPTHIRLAGDFTTAYASALVLLHYVTWLAAVGALMFLIYRKLRLPPPGDN